MMIHWEVSDGSGSTVVKSPSSEWNAASVVETTDLRFLEPEQITFAQHGADLRLTLEDERCYLNVTVLRSFPLSDPHRYLSVRDADGNEIGVLVNPKELNEAARRLVEAALQRRYMVPVIERVESVKERFGTLDWQVQTDRGRIKFTTRNVRENASMLSPDRYLITDVDGNRFEIRDLTAADPAGSLLRYL